MVTVDGYMVTRRPFVPRSLIFFSAPGLGDTLMVTLKLMFHAWDVVVISLLLCHPTIMLLYLVLLLHGVHPVILLLSGY